MQGWKQRLLSKAGKEILIKAVAQAIPVYAMSCFEITKTLCDEISAMIGRYWWSSADKDNKIHWVSWDKLTSPKKDGGLGFRDLYSFNLAMLAKQAWRLLKNPNSLSAKVLAAKYYPGGNILEAEAKSGMSYCWRSILKGIQVLKEGIIWRIGNGQTINIWSDPWLPRDESRKIRSVRGNQIITKVCELINPSSNNWDTQLLNQTFNAEEVKIIKTIPIQDGAIDNIAWHFDKKGNFSVKSAYQVVQNIKKKEEEQGSSSMDITNEGNNKIKWKKLWSIPLPGKVKHFLWRLANNSLPFRMKLKRKGINLDTRCPVCYRLDEDGGHCFLKCKHVKAFWREAELEEIRLQLLKCPDAKWFIIHILDQNEENCMKIGTLLWIWWKERNTANQGKRIRNLGEILYSFQFLFSQFWEHLKKRKEKKQSKMQVWSPPPEDFLKINSDGAFREMTRSGGWGFILRNEMGKALIAGAGPLHDIANPLQAEAMAMYHAIQEVARMGCQNLILETDASILRQALTSDMYDNADLGNLFRDMRLLIRLSFKCCIIQNCPRTCNIVAHQLAAYGAVQEREAYQVWLDPFPTAVKNVIAGVCPACVN